MHVFHTCKYVVEKVISYVNIFGVTCVQTENVTRESMHSCHVEKNGGKSTGVYSLLLLGILHSSMQNSSVYSRGMKLPGHSLMKMNFDSNVLNERDCFSLHDCNLVNH